MRNLGNSLERSEIKEKKRVIFKIFLQRHGPKAKATVEQNELAPYFVSSVESSSDRMVIGKSDKKIHIATSPIDRAVNTADVDADKLSAKGHKIKNQANKVANFATPYKEPDSTMLEKYAHDSVILIDLQKNLESEARQKVEQENPDASQEEKEMMVRNIVDTELLKVVFNAESSENFGLQASYEDMADNLAQRYKGFFKHIRMLDAGGLEDSDGDKDNPYVQIDVSHAFPIMSFLKKYLVFDDGVGAEGMTADQFFDRVGGVIRESDFLEIEYVEDGGEYFINISGEFLPAKKFNGQINFDQYEKKD